EIEDYFPNYVGITGDAFYVDEDLKKLSLELPIEFYGKVEVVGFTQFLYSQVQEIFPNHYDLELTVTSSDGVESVIYQKARSEEHTSELQSRFDLVCRLLLEKKKNRILTSELLST